MTKLPSPGLERSARQPHQLRPAVADQRFSRTSYLEVRLSEDEATQIAEDYLGELG